MKTPKYKRVGEGSTHPNYKNQRRIIVSFDQETFQQIREQAATARNSFAEQVRLYVEWGMMEENK